MKLGRFRRSDPLGFRISETGGVEAAADFAARAHRHTVRLSAKVAGLAFALAVAIWVIITLVGWHEQAAAIAHAKVEAANLSAALADEIDQTLSIIDRAMVLFADQARDQPGPLDLRPLQIRLARLARPVVQGGLIGPDGKLRASTLLDRTEPLDLSDREHFRVHLDGSQRGLFISKPLLGRLSGRTTIQLSRRVEKADGTFLGVVVFSLSPDELTAPHQTLDVGEHGTIGLVGLDGIVRARFHPGEATPAEVLRFGAATLPALAPDEVTSFIHETPGDHVVRLVTLRRLADYPLIVGVCLGLDDVMAFSRVQIWLVRGTGVVLTVLLGGLTGLLVRELWRRTQREVELAREQAHLHAANAEVRAERAKLAAANLELQAISERAEAANRAKSRFLAQMSHELRTPLHAIIGFAEVIKDLRARPQPDAPVTDYASQIWNAGRNLLEIINAILDIARLDAGTAQLVEATVRTADPVRSAIAAVRSQAQAHRIAIVADLPRDLPILRVDPGKLRQILVNLLSNAVKFSPAGADVAIAAHADPAGGLVLEVADSGIGMSAEEIAIALEPFGRSEGSFARAIGGAGLGLPLAKRLAELHGGTLRIRSTVGRGTTVAVLIPPYRVIRQSETASEAPGAAG